jgi:hypothetical protein
MILTAVASVFLTTKRLAEGVVGIFLLVQRRETLFMDLENQPPYAFTMVMVEFDEPGRLLN